MEKLLSTLVPILSILAAPLLFWPTIILTIALIRQARGAMVLKMKHFAIFIGLQIVWLLIMLVAFFVLLRPLNLSF